MKYITHTLSLVGGLIAVSLLCPSASAQNLIINGGFESPLAGNWNTFGNAFLSAGGPTPHGGVEEAKLYGTFPGTSGFYQPFVAAPGDAFDANGWGQNWSGDQMQASNEGFIRVTFFNASNVEIAGGGANSGFINLSTPTNTWEPLNITDVVAPTGTAYGQVYLLFTQPGTNGGSAWFDDISVTAAPEPMTMLGLTVGVVALLKRRRAKA